MHNTVCLASPASINPRTLIPQPVGNLLDCKWKLFFAIPVKETNMV